MGSRSVPGIHLPGEPARVPATALLRALPQKCEGRQRVVSIDSPCRPDKPNRTDMPHHLATALHTSSQHFQQRTAQGCCLGAWPPPPKRAVRPLGGRQWARLRSIRSQPLCQQSWQPDRPQRHLAALGRWSRKPPAASRRRFPGTQHVRGPGTLRRGALLGKRPRWTTRRSPTVRVRGQHLPEKSCLCIE